MKPIAQIPKKKPIPKEREECAQVCDKLADASQHNAQRVAVLREAADLIRNRVK